MAELNKRLALGDDLIRQSLEFQAEASACKADPQIERWVSDVQALANERPDLPVLADAVIALASDPLTRSTAAELCLAVWWAPELRWVFEMLCDPDLMARAGTNFDSVATRLRRVVAERRFTVALMQTVTLFKDPSSLVATESKQTRFRHAFDAVCAVLDITELVPGSFDVFHRLLRDASAPVSPDDVVGFASVATCILQPA